MEAGPSDPRLQVRLAVRGGGGLSRRVAQAALRGKARGSGALDRPLALGFRLLKVRSWLGVVERPGRSLGVTPLVL